MANKYTNVHRDPKGLGDARPTATQIIKDEGLEGKLSDQVILITGASGGIGVETARALFLTGATLYLTARDLAKAKSALDDLVESDRVHLLELDLSSLESVRQCAATFLSKSATLNILINNAGVGAPPEGRTKDGFETQIGINHFAHFLLFYLLEPALRAGAQASAQGTSSLKRQSRVITISSLAHRYSEFKFDNFNFENGAYNAEMAYGSSKTANLWTSNEIDRRYGSQGIHAWAVQPGFTQTDLYRHMGEEGLNGLLSDPYMASIFKTTAQGAATTVWAAVAAELEGKGGGYAEDCQLAGPWDPNSHPVGPGTAPWAFDTDKAARLWDLSVKVLDL
ncbi:unnamed protein product [Clonostachys rosea f. rosea IK726]|jgi:NAD(P)-dependent dehydrogenase (short-subunit alcohol dehydrogenase family)|uniref:Uncharacterized protein n=1 Tax=Clonostachys rosea f. rosea IK726 TaxID=1349383 RepID=A0ACA9U662_BIOOC|nr:unnamed protein product [Clonostachys rosea f. rosea IK726]